MLAEAFDQIRECEEGNIGIIARMLNAFEILAELTTSTRRRKAIHEQVLLIAELACRTTNGSQARERIAKKLREVRESLKTNIKRKSQGNKIMKQFKKLKKYIYEIHQTLVERTRLLVKMFSKLNLKSFDNFAKIDSKIRQLL